MREDEPGQPRVLWRSHPWTKQISSVAAHVSAAALVAMGAASSLAARKNTNRKHGREGNNEDEASGREGGKSRDGNNTRETAGEQDRDVTREQSNTAVRDGGGNRVHDRNRERDVSETTNDRQVRKEQTSNPDKTPEATETPEATNTGGGIGDNFGNAGSGLFDSPLATKTRRRANDFENRDPDAEDEEIVVEVNPDGESVYETDSVFFATGPEGLEIQTKNITYFAEPTPTPTPLPVLELPAREPGFPFGEDFPFGNEAGDVTPRATEPSDPGDTGNARGRAGDRAPADSDGGDNSMDFTS